MSQLEGKVVVVTGAGRGIGRGIALRCAGEGAAVVVASRSREPLDETCAQIEAKGGRVHSVIVDVADREQIQAMVASAVSRFGRLDVLVNNAQAYGPPGRADRSLTPTPLAEFGEDEWDHTFRTGAKATLFAMQAAFPHLRESQGTVVNMSSPYGKIGNPGTVAYNANKEAIAALTRTAAREWGQYGITCNVMYPIMRTDMMAEALRRSHDEFDAAAVEAAIAVSAQRQILGRYGDSERDAGGLVVFLAGDSGRYFTGESFHLDGGMFVGNQMASIRPT